MSCSVMMYHQAYPSSSPYLPPPPPNQNQLPPLSGFDARIPPSNTSPPISQPQSPNLRLNPNSNGLNTAHIIEPKVEKNLEVAPTPSDAYGQMLRTSNSPNSRPNSAHLHHRRESEVGEKAENIAEDYSASTQNASENSVVYTYYKGSPENAVEEHFERTRKAIKENSEGYGEQNLPAPMKQRILPASFWTLPQLSLNGGNHAGQTTPATSSSTLPTSSYADLYSDQLQNHANMLNQLPEWWSAQSAQSSYVQRSAASPYYNHTRFHHQPSSQYWAAASRLAASQVKGEWPQDYQAAAQAALTTAAGLHNPASEFTHPYQAAAASLHHYPNMPGLESASMQEPSKEIYGTWPGF